MILVQIQQMEKRVIWIIKFLTNIDIDMFLEGAEIDAEDQEQTGDDG